MAAWRRYIVGGHIDTRRTMRIGLKTWLARRGIAGLVAALVAIPALAAAPAMAAEPLTVFAAASLKNSLDEVDAAYTRATGQPVRASYAASSALSRQISQGAPADVFISADSDWMDALAKQGQIQPATRRDLLTNHLALIAPVSSGVSLRIGPHMPLAKALGEGRLAMAGPDVPAGRYGRQALTALGVWPEVEAKAVYGESVRAALVFVDRGEAPLGIVYDTDAKVDPGVRVVGLFPETSHPPIRYPIALTKAARPQADAYLRYLEGPEAAAIFRKYGFVSLKK
jgi:molybdate transport system substrate-binding protein